MEPALLTLAEAEKRHEKIKAELRNLRRAMRTNQDIDGLADQVCRLKIEARALYAALQKHQAIAEYLANCECYGSAH